LRQVNGSPQVAQILVGSSAFLRIFGIKDVLFGLQQNWRFPQVWQPRPALQNPLTSPVTCRNPSLA
jgi:hypothetical protein